MFMMIRNRTGPRTVPWGTPALTGLRATRWLRVEEVSQPCVELALDAIGREFGEQGGMPDCIKRTKYVQRDCPDLVSDILCWVSRSSMSKVQ